MVSDLILVDSISSINSSRVPGVVTFTVSFVPIAAKTIEGMTQNTATRTLVTTDFRYGNSCNFIAVLGFVCFGALLVGEVNAVID